MIPIFLSQVRRIDHCHRIAAKCIKYMLLSGFLN